MTSDHLLTSLLFFLQHVWIVILASEILSQLNGESKLVCLTHNGRGKEVGNDDPGSQGLNLIDDHDCLFCRV